MIFLKRLRLRWLVLLCCVCFSLASATSMAMAQRSFRAEDTATVVLDGRSLFEVQAFQNFSAAERAKQVNVTLAESLVEFSSMSSVAVMMQNNDLTLELINPEQDPPAPQYLLTITESDVLPGLDAQVQAETWQKVLNDALVRARQERTPGYIRRTLIHCGVITLAAILIHLCMRGGKRYGKRREAARRGSEPSQSPLLSLVLLGLQMVLWLGLLFYISDQFPLLRQWRYSLLNNIATRPLFTLNQQPYSTLDLVILAALLLALWLAVRSLTVLLRSRILSVFGVQRGLQEAISILTQYVLTFLGFIIILQVLGIDISSILILGSALGVGIGFGLQNIVNNFISGIILLVERPVAVGNFIKVGSLLGTVERIGARSTEIRTLDQVTIIVPNAQFVETEVVNWDYGNPVSRIHLPVGVAYGADIQQVQQILLAAVSDHPSVLAYPKPQVWMKGFGESAIEFEVLVWLLNPREQYRLQSDLFYRMEAALRDAKIDIPFPQQDVHLRSPQLNALLERLLMQYPETRPSGLIYPNRADDKTTSPPQRSPRKLAKIKATTTAPLDFHALATRMRGEKGVDIRDRRHRLNLYPQCFVGVEAVEWLMQDQQISRVSAVNLGQALLEHGLIHHVLDEHPFKDAFLFYRFYDDERAVLGKE